MKLNAGIRTLHLMCALALFASAPVGVVAQNAVPAVPTNIPASPAVVPESAVPAPVVAPPIVKPPVVAPAPKPVPKKGPVDTLKPGQYVWIPQDRYEGPMKIVVVLDTQRVYVFQNDKLIGFSTISSGKKGKETPIGAFNILQKNIDHKSNLYSNAPMPFMQRLTWDGIAIHGGYVPGYPASHGCIRLPLAFAKSLFAVTKLDQEVVVLKDTSTPVKRNPPKPEPMVDPAPAPLTSDPSADASVTPPSSPPKPDTRT
jgi:lipoprotein-anchoring transpeptidase ErfK/SrfK